MAQEIEIIVKKYSPGQLRPKVTQVRGGTTNGVITGDKEADEIMRFAAYVATDANVGTMLTDLDAAVTANGGVVLR
jgi:hypothetical protein